MFQGKFNRSLLLFILACLLPNIVSKSITFSYRTCLPHVNLINIELFNRPILQLFTKDFRLHLIYTYEQRTIEYQFGHFNFSLPYSASFDYQFQTAIDYYHEIDTWNYVNITFNDQLSKIFISFNGDETRLIPVIDYPMSNFTTNIHIDVLIDEQQENVTCLLPYSGFKRNAENCSLNIKTCGLCH